jgi:hypothetical protein
VAFIPSAFREKVECSDSLFASAGDQMKKCLLVIGLWTLLIAPLPAQSQGKNARSVKLVTQKAFFNNIRKMCGQRFEGVTEFPQNADHPMVGKKLLMFVESCTEKEIRIPFHVGDDKSRTWILTFGEQGLLFKQITVIPMAHPIR